MSRVFAWAPVALVALACSSKAPLVGAGGECEQATDCQEGLICIPQKGGTSVCSGNLNSVQQLAPTPDAALPPLPPPALSEDASVDGDGAPQASASD